MTRVSSRKMIKAKIGDTVKIHFTCKLEDGTIFDSSAGKEPLAFTVGEHQVMQGLEDAVVGMTGGESKSFIIAPDKAFGPHLAGKVRKVKADQFPADLQPAVGMKFEIRQEDNTTTVIRVTAVSESGITLDTNHPLAGKDLFFDVELLDVTPSPIDYNAADEFYKKGIELQDKGQIDESIAYYQKALGQNSKHTGAYYNLGVALQEKGLLDQAIVCYEIAIGFKQDFTDAHHNLGVAFKEKGRFDDALLCFQRVLQLQPDHAGAYYNTGNVLVAKGQFDNALRYYQKAVEIEPGNSDAHWNMALLNLLAGNFEEGWKGYEWRWKLKDVVAERQFSQPLWDGADINGRTILLYAEQGFGDTLQFIRYAPLLAKRGAKVAVECPKEMTALIGRIQGIEQVIPYGEPLPECDVRYPLLSLPLIFNTTLQNIPAEIPYISADPSLVRTWGARIASNDGKFKIGLVWSGDPGFKNDSSRSCNLDIFSPLAHTNHITFYSLQKGEAATQANHPPINMNLVDYTKEISDFADTAAFIQNLDLIISIDTAVAHLAGALGKPVWTLLPFVPDWRWMLKREDSPWYPTMRLFRQDTPADWVPVVARIKESLDDFSRSKT
jgi:FKBP-type peptidyl-prolyl cis-trans isomerase 2